MSNLCKVQTEGAGYTVSTLVITLFLYYVLAYSAKQLDLLIL